MAEPDERVRTSKETLAVVTGMSGAGKSTALHALEDLSFFCVDNLPIPLIDAALSLCTSAGLTRVALGIDVRVRSFLDDAVRVLEAVGTQRDLHVLFLDASDEALLRRYSETRRPHPLSSGGQPGGGAVAALDGISAERERLASLRACATLIVDTTNLSVHELRRRMVNHLGPASGQSERMLTRIVSFGFKYGMPVDADIVLDVRFLDNPYFIPELRDLPGTHPDVVSFLFKKKQTLEFFKHASDLLAFSMPRYEREGKSYLTIAVGCTGGRHRSVATANRLATQLRPLTGLPITVVHRDIDRHITASEYPPEGDVIGGGPRGKGEA